MIERAVYFVGPTADPLPVDMPTDATGGFRRTHAHAEDFADQSWALRPGRPRRAYRYNREHDVSRIQRPAKIRAT